MKNIPKFVIAKNEAAAPGSTYVVHTQEPAFIGEIYKFQTVEDRDEFQRENASKEIIVVNRLSILEIKKYLESPDHDKRREYLNDRIRHWIIANYLNSSAFDPK